MLTHNWEIKGMYVRKCCFLSVACIHFYAAPAVSIRTITQFERPSPKAPLTLCSNTRRSFPSKTPVASFHHLGPSQRCNTPIHNTPIYLFPPRQPEVSSPTRGWQNERVLEQIPFSILSFLTKTFVSDNRHPTHVVLGSSHSVVPHEVGEAHSEGLVLLQDDKGCHMLVEEGWGGWRDEIMLCKRYT